MITLGSWLRQAEARLRRGGRDAPRLSAELLAAHALNVPRTARFTQDDRTLAPPEHNCLEAALARRLDGEPLAYILRARAFYGRDFRITPDTLIPRAETEHLVEAALACPDRPLHFADLGTGSGCIAVTLAAERPLWRGVAVDCSPGALRVARTNARAHHVASRLLLVRADMCRPLFRPGSLDLVVSNPPYVSLPEYRELAPEVRREPQEALTPLTQNPASPHGLECLEAVIRQAAVALAPGGRICLEHGSAQARAVSMCFFNNNWSDVRVVQDLAGHDRITTASRSQNAQAQPCGGKGTL
ncbi:MAG: peptide chain release factor N(5)-glutamine methyltransferase [Deltaproteobacteria bacterium]|jgi:release factor glutamine methyltransferase|nr:peptide chain release factor N(5)-glutamine methyltransferase [Deltaproteobacteria bacterium]